MSIIYIDVRIYIIFCSIANYKFMKFSKRKRKSPESVSLLRSFVIPPFPPIPSSFCFVIIFSVTISGSTLNQKQFV